MQCLSIDMPLQGMGNCLLVFSYDYPFTDSNISHLSYVTSCISISSKSNCISYPHYQNNLPKLTSSSTSIRSQIGRLDGVILLNWDDSTLERQIEYGVKMGEIEFEAAKAELRNFRRNVIPVAEYFDYKQLLYVVSRFRFSDFRFQMKTKYGCLFIL